MATPPRPTTGESAMSLMAQPQKKATKKVIPLLDERPVTGGFRSAQVEVLSTGKDPLAKVVDEGGATPQTGAPARSGTAALAGRPEVQKVPIIDKLPFNIFVALTVFGNIFVLGLEQDQGPDSSLPMTDRMMWYALELAFIVCFTIEICIRIYCTKTQYFFKLANVLDFILVGVNLCDTLFLVSSGNGLQTRAFLVCRALHMVRFVRLVRMFPAFRELWLLVGGLANSVQALMWVGIVILIILYVGSIFVTTEIGQNDETYGEGPSYDGQVWPYKKYFGSVSNSMFTLFQIMTLDSWCDDIVRHVVYRQPVMAVFFIVFIVITAFGLINVIIGIIVENTLAAAAVADRRIEEREEERRKQAVEQLQEILEKSDSRRTGEISLEEIRAACQSKIVQEKFQAIGLTMDEVKDIMGLLDYDRRGRVELQRFASSCRELIGGAKRRDIAQVEVTIGTLAMHLDKLDKRFSHIETEVSGLTSTAEDFMQNVVRVLTGFDGSVKPPTKVFSTPHGQRMG